MRARLFLLLATCAVASPAGAHDWYAGLRSPSGERCCQGRDCRPVAMCVGWDRREGLLVGDACLPIPWDKVLPLASPDGRPHACWRDPPEGYGRGMTPALRCVILPGSA